MKNERHRYVVCISNRGYKASLEIRKIYRALPDPEASKDGMIRVIDESGEDYLFSSTMFVPIDVPEEVVRTFKKAS